MGEMYRLFAATLAHTRSTPTTASLALFGLHAKSVILAAPGQMMTREGGVGVLQRVGTV